MTDFDYVLGVGQDDTAKRSFLSASLALGGCIECGGRVRIFNRGTSVHIAHLDGCPELAAVAAREIPDTFRS